jgi:hypothetical protein
MPDPIAPDRLEELLGSALPEGEREARVQGLVRELRSDAGPAPSALRERVRTLAAEPPRRREPAWRPRAALAVALVLVAVAAVGAGLALRGGTAGGDDAAGDAPAALEPTAGAETVPTAVAPQADASEEDGRYSAAGHGGAASPLSGDEAVADRSSLAPTGRARDVDLRLELRLPGADELSDAAGEAMAVVRELGGWVAGSELETDGNEGEAELALRVPVGRLEDAVVRLSGLGTVTAQRVETVDLQAGIDARGRRLEQHERAIRVLELRLESGTLDPAAELRARLELERRRAAVEDLLRANARDRRDAATSELTLRLHTREAPVATPKEEGVGAAVARALDILGAAAAIGLAVLIVGAPLVLAALLLWLALRARSRRVEARLLERPAAPAPPGAPGA